LRNDVLGFAYDSLSNGFGNARSVWAMIKKTHNYEYIELPPNSTASNRLAKDDDTETTGFSSINTSSLKLLAYPNPFKDELNIRVLLPDNAQDVKLQLIEPASGRILLEKPLSAKQQELVFDTKDISSGLYLISISGTNITTQFIKVTTFK